MTDPASGDDYMGVCLWNITISGLANSTCQVRWGRVGNGSKLYIILID